jgi:hypothetical protein
MRVLSLPAAVLAAALGVRLPQGMRDGRPDAAGVLHLAAHAVGRRGRQPLPRGRAVFEQDDPLGGRVHEHHPRR